MQQKTAVIFGGTGFIGKILTRALAKENYTVLVATRHTASAYDLKPCGRVGQIVPVACDYSEEGVANIIPQGVDVVVNLIGMLYERKSGDFGRAHTEIPFRIAKACTAKKAGRFIHVSALGIEDNKSRYAHTKFAGELAIREEYPSATMIRPSVVFGPEDDFMNKFARLSFVMPFLPLIGGGRTKFQPVYVKDVVDTIVRAMTIKDTKGQIIECVGPETLDFKDIYRKIFKFTQRPRALISLPWSLASFQAAFLGLLPNPLLTKDQVKSLKTDNVASGKNKTMQDIGVSPTPMDVILPHYLCKYQRGGMFGKLDKQA